MTLTCTVWWQHSHNLTFICNIKACLGYKSQTELHFLSGIDTILVLDSSVSYSCAYSVGLSDISAVEQIREESELNVRRKPPFQICNQAKQQTTQTLRQSVSQTSHRHFFSQFDFIVGRVQRNTAECAAVNNSLPPTLSTFMPSVLLETAMWYDCIFPY